jgi:nucleoside-diphosphate-sugar epimerase
MSSSALVVGGTGPTGPFLVRGLRERGFRVSILHRGTHEVDELDAEVEHIHTDPFDGAATAAALGDRRFDLAIVTYGRLRMLAELLGPRVGRFLSVGGAPAYRGFMDPAAWSPAGLPTPTREDAPLVTCAQESRKGHSIVRTEQQVFARRPDATHFRYPYVYGPRQPMPREWCIVRRMRDRRPCLVVPDGGLTLCTFGYAENLAHAVLLAVDAPAVSAGQIYNCGDAEILSLRQVIEILATALDWRGELVSMPWALARCARPLVMQPQTTHRMLDLGKLRAELGYRDAVAPAEALARTAAWLLAHPPEPGGLEETVLQDPFDYAAEDRLVRDWRAALSALPDPGFVHEPGYTLSWEAPGSSDDLNRRSER